MSVDPAVRLSPAALRCLPFGAFIAGLVLRGLLEDHTAIDTRWLYALQAGVAAVALMWLWRRFGELRARPPQAGAAALAGLLASVVLGLLVFALWITLTAPWMRLGEPAAAFVPVDDAGRLQWSLIAVRAAGAVLVVPLIEELFWRSFLMRWIDRRDFVELAPQAVSWRAVGISSLLFALGHDLWLAGVLAGLAFGALYRLTGSIWNAVLAGWVVSRGDWGFW
jgi:CAAX prenyl protease-like protein